MSQVRSQRGVAVEEFVQALTAQLDRAQDLLALKARTGRPLTFALKDLTVDLRVFWESDANGRLLMRHAAPNEEGASAVKLGFTTITKAMAEENTVSLAAEEDPRGLTDLRGPDALGDDDRRRLELVGVRTVGQLKRLHADTDPKSVESYLGIPVMRLQNALNRASQPAITSTTPVPTSSGRTLLRIRGANLSNGEAPEVRLSGERVEVLDANPGELLVRPLAHHVEGAVEISLGAHGSTRAPYVLPAAPEALRRPEAAVSPLSKEGEP